MPHILLNSKIYCRVQSSSINSPKSKEGISIQLFPSQISKIHLVSTPFPNTTSLYSSLQVTNQSVYMYCQFYSKYLKQISVFVTKHTTK